MSVILSGKLRYDWYGESDILLVPPPVADGERQDILAAGHYRLSQGCALRGSAATETLRNVARGNSVAGQCVMPAFHDCVKRDAKRRFARPSYAD